MGIRKKESIDLMTHKYSVVIPVFNSEKSLEDLYMRIKRVFENVIHEEYEIIFVDDFSKDSSFDIISRLHENDDKVIAIQLSRNCGQHPALLCGFSYATGDYIITMDDDLQHPPEEIPKLIEKMYSDEDVDVVIGKYESKKHNWFRNLGSQLADYVSYKFYGKPRNLSLTSFRLIKKSVVDDLLTLKIDVPRIGNMIINVNGRVKNVIVEHDERKYGRSGYTISRLVKDLLNSVINNSSFPLKLVRDIGLMSLIISIGIAVFYLYRYFSEGISVVGWTSLMLIIVFYCGMTLMAIGIIGDYLIKILNETKKIPKYYVRKILRNKKEAENGK